MIVKLLFNDMDICNILKAHVTKTHGALIKDSSLSVTTGMSLDAYIVVEYDEKTTTLPFTKSYDALEGIDRQVP